MKHLLLVALMLPLLGWAQPGVAGLGNYIIGITTPASLSRAEFEEEDQLYVKGTIALPCTHIRTFTSPMVEVAGIPITNLVLAFHDNTLFSIICDYSDTLKRVFTKRYGPGVQKPMSRFQYCTTEKDKPLLMWGEAWPGMDVQAIVTYIKGYTADCKPKDGAIVRILNQKIMALSSECDLKLVPPIVEEFDKAQKESRGKQRPK